MKKTLLVAAALAAISLGVVHESRAGLRVSYPVTVNTTSRTAYGALGTARNSSDNLQRIGCYVFRFSNDGYAWCDATNSAGTSVACTTNQPGHLIAIESVKGDSFLYFTWQLDGDCNWFRVGQDSRYEPKQ